MLKKIHNKADMLEGCINRMCVVDSQNELINLYAYLNLYATDLYRLNRERLYIVEYGDQEPPTVDL